MRNITDKSCRENQNTHFYFEEFSSEDRAVCQIMWANVVQVDRPEMTIWCKRIACRIPKATDTDSEYVVLISFTLQQWLQELASISRYTHVACLVISVATITKSDGINQL